MKGIGEAASGQVGVCVGGWVRYGILQTEWFQRYHGWSDRNTGDQRYKNLIARSICVWFEFDKCRGETSGARVTLTLRRNGSTRKY